MMPTTMEMKPFYALKYVRTDGLAPFARLGSRMPRRYHDRVDLIGYLDGEWHRDPNTHRQDGEPNKSHPPHACQRGWHAYPFAGFSPGRRGCDVWLVQLRGRVATHANKVAADEIRFVRKLDGEELNGLVIEKNKTKVWKNFRPSFRKLNLRAVGRILGLKRSARVLTEMFAFRDGVPRYTQYGQPIYRHTFRYAIREVS